MNQRKLRSASVLILEFVLFTISNCTVQCFRKQRHVIGKQFQVLQYVKADFKNLYSYFCTNKYTIEQCHQCPIIQLQSTCQPIQPIKNNIRGQQITELSSTVGYFITVLKSKFKTLRPRFPISFFRVNVFCIGFSMGKFTKPPSFDPIFFLFIYINSMQRRMFKGFQNW